MATFFIATSFDSVNRVRADSISSVLRASSHDVIVGEEFSGDRISDAICDRIRSADALIAMLSRRHNIHGDKWSTHPWVIEEAVWADAHQKHVLRIVEEGVSEIGGISGDVEIVRFQAGQFESCIPRIITFSSVVNGHSTGQSTLRPVERRATYSIASIEQIEDSWGDEVKELIERTRRKAEAELYLDALDLSNKALSLSPECWRAHINKSVALVHLGEYENAKNAIDNALAIFTDSAKVIARLLHNKAWLMSMQDGLENEESLRRRKELYMQSLTLDNHRIYTRAMVLICMLLLHEESEAKPFIETSLKWGGFVDALREEIQALGGTGIKLYNELPEWLKHLIFPTHKPILGTLGE